MLAVNHPSLIKAPIVTAQSPLEGMNDWRLMPLSNNADLGSRGQIVHPRPWITATLLLSHTHTHTHWKYSLFYVNVKTQNKSVAFYGINILNKSQKLHLIFCICSLLNKF